MRAYVEADRAFVDAVVSGAPPAPSLDDALVAHRLVDAAYRSAAAGGVPITLHLKPPPLAAAHLGRWATVRPAHVVLVVVERLVAQLGVERGAHGGGLQRHRRGAHVEGHIGGPLRDDPAEAHVADLGDGAHPLEGRHTAAENVSAVATGREP